MRIHRFESELWLSRPRPEVFAFFSDPANLEAITPPWLNFCTIRPGPIKMQTGVLIEYKLRLHGIPIRWKTRINVWEPPIRFEDEQVREPYRRWIHEHTFEERDDGIIVRDRVRYAAPFDFLVHSWLVRPDVERIFAYRARMLCEQLGGAEEARK